MNSKLDNTSKSLKQDQYKRLISMNAVPSDLSNYFVKVKSAESKEMLLPVQSVAESTKDGRAVYKVTVSLPELVQESETGYKPDMTSTSASLIQLNKVSILVLQVC